MGAAARQHAARPLPVGPSRPVGPGRPAGPTRFGRRIADQPRVIATRRHGNAAATGPQPLVRATAGMRSDHRPHLVLVVPRGRRAAHVAVVMSVVVGLAMLGAAAFQTQLAQRQVELDRLAGDIRASREQYEVLRRERAELRSPGRLAGVASANGMVPSGDSAFLSIQPDVLAIVAASTGDIDPGVLGDGRSTLDDFRDVKATTSIADGASAAASAAAAADGGGVAAP